jgi:hypothetical protein
VLEPEEILGGAVERDLQSAAVEGDLEAGRAVLMRLGLPRHGLVRGERWCGRGNSKEDQ